MIDERNNEITCEYYTVRSNENKCKALDIEFHNCLIFWSKRNAQFIN